MVNRRMPHQFRFQLIAKWLTENYSPRKAADVGGGKGLLAYFLNQQGWDVTVIDPVNQLLPKKYKDMNLSKRLFIPKESKVSRIDLPFEENMAKDFDLLIGLHAHGSNMKIINASVKYGKDFVLFPCCVIDEPIEIKPNINWFNSLEDYAKDLGLQIKSVKLNFVRQSSGFFTQSEPTQGI